MDSRKIVAKDQGEIVIVYVLNNNSYIVSKKEIEQYKDRFNWINESEIENMVWKLRSQTDISRKSVILIEENKNIKACPNISKNFTKYNLLSKVCF